MTSYVALIVAFLMTVVGIVGNTWNANGKGLRRLTRTAWAVLFLAVAALVIGASQARQKDAEIRDVFAIRKVANRQILDAASYLLRHLMSQYEMRFLDNDALFAAIRNPENLSVVGQRCLLDAPGGTTLDGFGGVGGGFEQPWQLYDFNIDHGRKMLDDVIVKYASFVTPTLLLKIGAVLSDDFFVNTFPFTPHRFEIELDPDETKHLAETNKSILCSPYGTIGLHYFKAVYLPGKHRAPDYQAFFQFLAKLQALVDYAHDRGALRMFTERPPSPKAGVERAAG